MSYTVLMNQQYVYTQRETICKNERKFSFIRYKSS